MNGCHWCAEIRKVPVIFISSASDSMNIIMAVHMGGDDFIAKPFNPGLPAAKVQALLHRAYDYGAAAPMPEHNGTFLNTGEKRTHLLGTKDQADAEQGEDCQS